VPSAQEKRVAAADPHGRRKPVARYEDLLVWQKARALTNRVYTVTACGPFAKDFGLRGQIQRAAVSVLANIAEGFDRNSRAEFARFLNIARGSAGEVKCHVYVAEDLGYLDARTAAELRARCQEITRMVIALRKSIGG
jgi:four helix bundle protein